MFCGLVSVPILTETWNRCDVNVIFVDLIRLDLYATIKANNEITHANAEQWQQFWFDNCLIPTVFRRKKFSHQDQEATRNECTIVFSLFLFLICVCVSCSFVRWKCVNLNAEGSVFNGNFRAVNDHLLIDTLYHWIILRFKRPAKTDIRTNSSARAQKSIEHENFHKLPLRMNRRARTFSTTKEKKDLYD